MRPFFQVMIFSGLFGNETAAKVLLYLQELGSDYPRGVSESIGVSLSQAQRQIELLGAIVCQSLRDAGIDSFLSGGAVVSIYSNNRYESYDLDFVSFGDRKKIRNVMEKLGFLQEKSRLYRHPKSPYMVEFPGTAVQIGDEPIKIFAERKVKGKTLKFLKPTGGLYSLERSARVGPSRARCVGAFL